MKIGRWILLAAILSIAAAFAGNRFRAQRAASVEEPGSYPDPALNVVAPAGVRIKVEVLNASTVRGLARRAAFYLRDRGFDVVFIGTSRDQRDTTLVVDRSGHPEWAELVARAMKGASESRPDSSRYLDLTVLVGASWRAPPRPFYP